MSTKKPDQFSMIVPDEREPERNMPSRLEFVDYTPGSSRAKKAMGGGAYDPYEKPQNVQGDTARIRRPRVDLRKLSEWIKTTQQVKALREDESSPAQDKPPRR